LPLRFHQFAKLAGGAHLDFNGVRRQLAVLGLCVQACNLGVPILAEESERLKNSSSGRK
jgi:hypothetical protein